MKVLFFLVALLALSAASIVPDKYEVNPNIDTTKLIERLSSIISHKLSHPVHNSGLSKNPINNAINAAIIKALEELREQLETGWDGVPPLDPFKYEDELKFDVAENFLLKVQIGLSDIIVTGLKDFIISNIDFRLRQGTFNFEFIVPQIDYKSKFEIDGKVASIIKVNPKGDAKIGLTNFATWGTIQFIIQETGFLSLENLELDFDAEDFSVYLEGLFETGKINELLNFVLNHLSNDFFQGQRERLTAWAIELLSEVLDEVLQEINIYDLTN